MPKKLAVICIILNLLTINSMVHAIPRCAEGHCAANQWQINEYCMKLGLSGQPFPLMDGKGNACLCTCSCVLPDTLVQTPKGPVSIQNLSDDGLTSALDGEKRIMRMLRSKVEDEDVILTTFENNERITTSTNHVFILNNFQTIVANKIQSGDRLLSNDNQALTVASITRSTHSGYLYDFVIGKAEVSPFHHAALTNAVYSGDYLVQTLIDRKKILSSGFAHIQRNVELAIRGALRHRFENAGNVCT